LHTSSREWPVHIIGKPAIDTEPGDAPKIAHLFHFIAGG